MDTQYITQQLDKIDYVEALIVIASADGNITHQKRDFIETQSALLGVDTTPLFEKSVGVSDLKTEGLSRVTKMSIIRDSISFAYMDGCYSQAEQEKIYKIAEKFEINKTDVDAMENWLKEYWLILDKGTQLLGLKK